MSTARDLDQFYTSPELAKAMVADLDFTGYDFALEPTAGTGTILDELPKDIRIAYDLEPKHPEVRFGDAREIPIPTGRGIIVGNLPFGKRNQLNIELITRFLQYPNIDTMALILPRAWQKHTLQKTFPRNWKLITDIVVPPDSFIFEDETYNVHCVIQVWTKLDTTIDHRWPEKPKVTTNDFDIIRDDSDYDFFVMGAAPRTMKEMKDVHTNNRGYKIKCNIDVDTVKQRFNNVPWEEVGCSGVGGGVFWITTPELIKHYESYN